MCRAGHSCHSLDTVHPAWRKGYRRPSDGGGAFLGDAYKYIHTDAYSNAEFHTETHTDAGKYANLGVHTYACADANTYPYADTDPHADSDTYADAYTNSDSNAYTNSDAYPYSPADTDAYSYSGTGSGDLPVRLRTQDAGI